MSSPLDAGLSCIVIIVGISRRCRVANAAEKVDEDEDEEDEDQPNEPAVVREPDED